MTEKTVPEIMNLLDRDIREAKRALWDGETGHAYEAVEACREDYQDLQEALEDD